MRESPSIVPAGLGRDVYLVLGDFGDRLGRFADTDRATLIRNLLEGRYSSPVSIVAFNTAKGWSRDVTEEIAAELAQAWLARACADRGAMPPSIANFIADQWLVEALDQGQEPEASESPMMRDTIECDGHAFHLSWAAISHEAVSPGAGYQNHCGAQHAALVPTAQRNVS